MKARTLIAACLMMAPLAEGRDGAGAGQGDLRDELAGAGRAWRFLSGSRRRHLCEVRARCNHPAGRPAGGQPALLLAGKIDFFMGGMMSAFAAVKEGVPIITVAAMFQKDPQILMAHPDLGAENSRDLGQAADAVPQQGGLTLVLSVDEEPNGIQDEQVKPYTFNPPPFIADKKRASRAMSPRNLTRSRRRQALSQKYFCSPTQATTPIRRPSRHAEDRRQKTRRRQAFRRGEHRLVQLSLRRQQGRKRNDQERKSGDDRRQVDYAVDKMKKTASSFPATRRPRASAASPRPHEGIFRQGRRD